MNVLNNYGLQVAAALLRNVTSGGYKTKVIALGIGGIIDQSELEGIATDPDSRNVILVDNFESLVNVEDELRDATCKGTTLCLKKRGKFETV